jgi:hypothetical protein
MWWRTCERMGRRHLEAEARADDAVSGSALAAGLR